MQRFYGNEELLENTTVWSPTVMERCAVRIEEDFCWHRALILEKHPDSKYTVCQKETSEGVQLLSSSYKLHTD